MLVSGTDKNDPWLFEQVWFLFLLGVSACDISEALRQFRELKSFSPTVLAPQDRLDMPLKTHTMKTPIFRSTLGAQTKRSALAPNITQAHSTQVPDEITSSDINESPKNFHSPQFQQHALDHVTRHLNDHTPHHTATNSFPPHRMVTSQDRAYDQGKKGYAFESYFRDRKFNGASQQSIGNLIRDFEICAV